MDLLLIQSSPTNFNFLSWILIWLLLYLRSQVRRRVFVDLVPQIISILYFLPYFLHSRKWEQLALFTSDLLIRNSTIIFSFPVCIQYSTRWSDKYENLTSFPPTVYCKDLEKFIDKGRIVLKYLVQKLQFNGSEMTWSAIAFFRIIYLLAFLSLKLQCLALDFK